MQMMKGKYDMSIAQIQWKVNNIWLDVVRGLSIIWVRWKVRRWEANNTLLILYASNTTFIINSI